MIIYIKKEITFQLAFFTFPPFSSSAFQKALIPHKGPENILDNVLEKDQPRDFPAPSSLCGEAGQETNGYIPLAEPTPSRNPTESHPLYFNQRELRHLIP